MQTVVLLDADGPLHRGNQLHLPHTGGGAVTRYAWMLQQVPTILGHLRDSMLPLAATRYDSTRVDGTREQPLPFRVEPMEDADTIWSELLDYGRIIAGHIHPAPHALTGTAARRIRASTQWHDAADAAYTVTAWLTHHEHRIAELDITTAGTDEALFTTIGRLLATYRITPARLRTTPTRCGLCGEQAVRAEWTINRNGDVARTVQCTVCLSRYEPEEVTDGPHLQGSSETSPQIRTHHQTLAS